MNRKILNSFRDWKNSKNRKPLLVRGARQVGKSYAIRSFGQKEYPNFLEVNFELYPDAKQFFKNKNPEEILTNLSLYFNHKIHPNTLLFLDEIQECPDAIAVVAMLERSNTASLS